MKTAVSNYQIVVEYPVTLPEKDQKDNLKKIESQLVKDGVKLSFADWGEKDLAYAIEGKMRAKFWLGAMSVDNGVEIDWNGLKTYMNRDKQIMRYLILKI